MRYLHELIGLAAVAAVVGWVQRAPAEAPARARYLCRPVHLAGHTLTALQAMLDDRGRVVPARSAALDSLDDNCQQMVQVFFEAMHD